MFFPFYSNALPVYFEAQLNFSVNYGSGRDTVCWLTVLRGDSSLKVYSEVLSSTTCRSEYMNFNFKLCYALQLYFGCNYLVVP